MVVLITGATGGLGRGLARALAKRGNEPRLDVGVTGTYFDGAREAAADPRRAMPGPAGGCGSAPRSSC